MTPNTASRLDKGIALVAIVALGAQQQNFPSAAQWKTVTGHASWLIPCLLIVAGAFSLGPFTTWVEKGLTTRRTALQRQILTYVGKLLTEAEASIPNFEHSDLGLHAWRVSRSARTFWQPRLIRVGTYRLGGSVVLRDFEPRKGEGVVGMCWRDNTEIDVDVEALASRVPTQATFEQVQSAEGIDAVMGLTWLQFQKVRHRGAVFASPIRDKRGRFRGCISLDASVGHALLKASAAPQTLNELTEMLSNHSFEEM